MAYQISATKLKSYARCPKAYYFRYECGLPGRGFFGSAALGNALHGALAQLYQDWHYQAPLPSPEWLRDCWDKNADGLTDKQMAEGWRLMQQYYEREIVSLGEIQKPLATEGRVQGLLQVNGIEFNMTGRYDRLDFLAEGLELIDYKSAKSPQLPSPEAIDLQLGLYYLALEQRYGQSLKRMSLLYLRTGERVSYEASETHKEHVSSVIGELSQRLLEENEWQPKCGDQCSQCQYAQYCPAIVSQPEAIAQKPRKLQLSLGF